MKLMFKKSYEELKALLSGIEGVWEESQKNKKVLRLNGGVMNWYESTGTIYFQGVSGSRYFCESFYGHPCPTSGKNYATANAFGGPSRPASLVAYPTRGMQHSYRNDSTRFRKACIFTTLCSVKTHALSLLGTTRLLSRSVGLLTHLRHFF